MGCCWTFFAILSDSLWCLTTSSGIHQESSRVLSEVHWDSSLKFLWVPFSLLLPSGYFSDFLWDSFGLPLGFFRTSSGFLWIFWFFRTSSEILADFLLGFIWILSGPLGFFCKLRFLRTCPGTLTDYLWASSGLFLRLLCTQFRILSYSLWNSSGILRDSSSNSPDFLKVSSRHPLKFFRTSFGLLLDFLWDSFGLLLRFLRTGILLEVRWDSHLKLFWISSPILGFIRTTWRFFRTLYEVLSDFFLWDSSRHPEILPHSFLNISVLPLRFLQIPSTIRSESLWDFSEFPVIFSLSFFWGYSDLRDYSKLCNLSCHHWVYSELSLWCFQTLERCFQSHFQLFP